MFSRVVTYHDFYRGIRRVSGLEDNIAAEVVLKDQPPALLHDLLTNPVALDNFLQVPGLCFNRMAPCPPQEAFVCVELESLQLSSNFLLGSKWDVFATSTPTGSDRQRTCDIFATDSNTGNLVFAAFGVKYEKIPIALFAKTLSREEQRNMSIETDPSLLTKQVEDNKIVAPDSGSGFNGIGKAAGARFVPKSSTKLQGSTESTGAPTPSEVTSMSSKSTRILHHHRQEVERKLVRLLSEMLDFAPERLVGQSSLDELGLDSLLLMEVASEIDSAFGISIPQEALQRILNVESLTDYLYKNGSVSLFREPAEKPALSPQLQDNGDTGTIPLSSRSQPVSPETPTELTGNTITQAGYVVLRLAQILGTHLECSATEFHPSTDLADKGLDSLLWMEVISDIEKMFDVTFDLALTAGSKYGELCDKLATAIDRHYSSQATSSPLSLLAHSGEIDTDSTKSQSVSVTSASLNSSPDSSMKIPPFNNAPDDFESIKSEFDKLADRYHFKRFFD